MSKRASTKRRSRAVLHLSPEWAEWAGPVRSKGAGKSYGSARAAVHGEGIEDLVDAAVRAIEAAGGKPGSVVLALSGALVEQRLVKLPPLSSGDLRKVCLRKAAGLLGADPKDTVFLALPMRDGTSGQPEDSGEGQGESRWLLVGQERERAVRLLTALRRKRIHVRKVTVARLARLSAAQELRGDKSKACVVIDVEPDAVDLSLIIESGLAHQTRLEGSLVENPSMALAVVQELRSFDSFWRRTHRGGSVGQVMLIGLDPVRAQLLLQAIDAALPEADITALPDVPEVGEIDPEETAGSGRIESLLNCRASGPFTADLTVHVPAPYTHVLTLVATLLVIGVGFGTLVYSKLNRQLHELELSAAASSFEARDLEEVVEANQRAEQAVGLVRAEMHRLVSAAALGIPLESTLREALGAFGDEAALISLSIDGNTGAVTIGGVTESDPARTVVRLEEVDAALDASPAFEAVEIESPTAFGEGGDLVAFAVKAKREGFVPLTEESQ